MIVEVVAEALVVVAEDNTAWPVAVDSLAAHLVQLQHQVHMDPAQ
jgi:hypothetical protein